MSDWIDTGHDGVKELEYQEIGSSIEDSFGYKYRFFLVRFPWKETDPTDEELRDHVRRNFAGWSCNCTHDCCGCSLGYDGVVVGKIEDGVWMVKQSVGRNL